MKLGLALYYMTNTKKHILKKRINFGLGLISLVLAYIGIVMPGIPGTPFILLTAFFFFKSSDRMYNWLLSKKLFAKIINEFSQKETIPLKLKLFVIVQLWISITVAEIWFITSIWPRIIVIVIGLICSLFILKLKKFKLN